jgi:hypothetical protein
LIAYRTGVPVTPGDEVQAPLDAALDLLKLLEQAPVRFLTLVDGGPPALARPAGAFHVDVIRTPPDARVTPRGVQLLERECVEDEAAGEDPANDQSKPTRNPSLIHESPSYMCY